jgi:UDP-N-acetylglucosamine acyltransferase
LKRAYEVLFRSGHRMAEAIKLARDEFKDSRDVQDMLIFMEGTKRGVCRSAGKDEEESED